MRVSEAIKHIEKKGILLVFPIHNQKEPPSLWSQFFPKSEMRWEWDSDGDDRVASLWHLREELSRSKKVVYSKWYQNRATLFSRPVFTSLLKLLGGAGAVTGLNPESRSVLTLLEENSPLSTKELKKEAGLSGKAMESTFNRALKSLWNRGLVVGFGEVDDGAFPSLAIGATQVLFEDLWRESLHLSEKEAQKHLEEVLKEDSLFLKYLKKLQNTTPSLVKGTTRKQRQVLLASDLYVSQEPSLTRTPKQRYKS